MDNLYQDYLLDLYRQPLNKRTLARFDVRRRERNPLCGDEVEIMIEFGDDERIAAIGWQGDGCVISQAAAALVTEHAKNKTKTQINGLAKEEVLSLLQIERLNPARLRCALLAYECLKQLCR